MFIDIETRLLQTNNSKCSSVHICFISLTPGIFVSIRAISVWIVLHFTDGKLAQATAWCPVRHKAITLTRAYPVLYSHLGSLGDKDMIKLYFKYAMISRLPVFILDLILFKRNIIRPDRGLFNSLDFWLIAGTWLITLSGNYYWIRRQLGSWPMKSQLGNQTTEKLYYIIIYPHHLILMSILRSLPDQWTLLTLSVWGPSHIGLIWSISWLLMPWLLLSPGHQQPWYCLCGIAQSWSFMRNDFNYLGHVNVEVWHEM